MLCACNALFVVSCSLRVVCYSLFVVSCLWLGVDVAFCLFGCVSCLLIVVCFVRVYCALFIARRVLSHMLYMVFGVCNLPLIVCYVLVMRCLWCLVHCVLFVVCCFCLFVVCYGWVAV